MRKSRFTETRIVVIPKEADGGMKAGGLCRKYGISNATSYKCQYFHPSKPNQNAYVEQFNRTYPGELLDQHLFTTYNDAREAPYWRMRDYNEDRPLDALADRTPAEARALAAENSTNALSLPRGSLRTRVAFP